jgi:hypothetical protein
MKFSDLGTDNLKDSSTFKKIQYFSKSNPQKLYSNVDEFNLKYKKLSDLYLSDYEPMTSSSYGLKRQHNYVSQKSSLSNSVTLLDSKSIDTLMNYNQNTSATEKYTPLSNSFKFHNHSSNKQSTNNSFTLNSKINSINSNKENLSLTNYMAFSEKNSLLSAENDSQQVLNPLKFALNNK